MPICKICNNEKHRRSSGKLVCKYCLNKRQTKYRKTHPQKVKQWEAVYRSNHADELAIKTRNRRKSIRYWFSSKLYVIKSRKSKEIHIDVNYLCELYKQQEGCCAISGLQMTTSENCLTSISIDRIDSTIDYHADNIQLLCKAINLGKKWHSNDRMIEIIKNINNPDLIKSPKCYRTEKRYKKRQRSVADFLLHKLNMTRRNKHHPISISLTDLQDQWDIQQGLCYITNLPLFAVLNDPLSISLDRIDPMVGYIRSNIVISCQWVNLARRDDSYEHIKLFIKQLKFCSQQKLLLQESNQ